MGGRVQVLVLVLAVASASVQMSASMQSNENSFVSDLTSRCEKDFGRQNAKNLMTILVQLRTCIKYDDLQKEVQAVTKQHGLKGGIETVCGKKDELLQCSDQAFGTIKKCLYQEEQRDLEILQRAIKPIMDFVCDHVDDIIAVVGLEERECVQSLQGNALHCNPLERTEKDTENILNSTMMQKCQMITEFTTCVNSDIENCKDSATYRLFNDFKRDVVDKYVCSKGSAGGLASVGTLPELVTRLILVVIVPYFLRL